MEQQDVAPPRELVHRNAAGHELALPRPDAEKPFTAETAINRALGADTKPGAIARSDDAPHIWSEIRQLGVQFGRLEKQVEITSTTVEGHRTTLQTVSVNTEALCVKHDQFKKDIDTISGNITNTLNGLIAGSEGRLSGKLEAISNETKAVDKRLEAVGLTVDGLTTGQARATSEINSLTKKLDAAEIKLDALNTDQKAAIKAINAVSPFIKWGLSGIAFLIVSGFGLGTWLWKSTIEPNIVESSAKRSQQLVEESLRNKALQTENETLKAENAALRKNQGKATR